MDKRIMRYYKQKQYGGRSTAARAADGVMLRLIIAFAAYLWFQSNVQNTVAAIALTAATMALILAALGLYRGLAFEKFFIREKERLRVTVLRERLLLESPGALRTLAHKIINETIENSGEDGGNAYVWCSQRAAALDEDRVLDAYHAAMESGAERLILVSLSPLTARATGMIKRLPLAAVCITQDMVLKEAGAQPEYAVSDADIEEYILKEQSLRDARKQRMQTQPFAAGRTKKYLLCAAVLFLASFVTGYPLYYRLLAGLCVALSGVAFFINRPEQGRLRERNA